ncbi:putative zinc-binding metallopeptidase [Flavobacterium piscis]|uniref:Substrate import-associated zinc metallohydrolase lipoprotein n=1 Tax=Flavobacterium piscis TaxID=1114874 RepID=A0ABU1Y3C4_9FLAO|nr:putative zinc-binding metallopeptidase [Flavobacterium piscis]MDR7208709.1 substrate import-associated zinc metallohydrolase lipoprotein [Flavobacterium piscis]
MKIVKQYTMTFLAIAAIAFSGCTREDQPEGSQLDVTNPPQSALDNWITDNYLNPYNINIQYKWNQNAVDNNRYLYPPEENKVQPVLEVIQKIWLDSYNAIAGPDFVKKIAPREIVMVGGANLDLTGTLTLGLAEGGQRVTLFETDNVDITDRENVKQFIHTIQHEYIHILNQHKPYDEKSMATITPSGYTANWYAISDADANEEGFITAYAKSNINEDFAEMASVMLINSKDEYEALLAGIHSEAAVAAIRAKEVIVVKYFKKEFNLDFYDLRDEAEKNTTAVLNGN